MKLATDWIARIESPKVEVAMFNLSENAPRVPAKAVEVASTKAALPFTVSVVPASKVNVPEV